MKNKDLQEYKDAVWDFIIEHCDITANGSYFVKFHTSSRRDFEKRVFARWKYDYHREDDRFGFNNRQKEADATARRQAHLSRKQAKKAAYKKKVKQRQMENKKIKEAMRQLARENKLKQRWGKLYPIHKRFIQPLARRWYHATRICLKNRLKLKTKK